MPLRLNARMRSTSDLARMPALSAASMWRRCAVPSAASLLRHLAVAEDGGQDVVEVVRDAAGQRADGLELLRLAQLRFEPLALGLGVLALRDVFHRAGHAVRPALRRRARHAALAVPVPVPAVVQPVLDLEVRRLALQVGLASARRTGSTSSGWWRVLSIHTRRGCSGSADSSEQFLRARRQEQDVAGQVPVPQAFVGAGHRELVALFGAAQRLLGALARVDVGGRSGQRSGCRRRRASSGREVRIQRTCRLSGRDAELWSSLRVARPNGRRELRCTRSAGRQDGAGSPRSALVGGARRTPGQPRRSRRARPTRRSCRCRCPNPGPSLEPVSASA